MINISDYVRTELMKYDGIYLPKEQKFKIWVYTSSYRRERYIRWLFRHYHIKFDKIINGTRHDQEVQRNKKIRLPSKLPSYYRISLHIDDEPSVVKNGKEYGLMSSVCANLIHFGRKRY